MRIVHYVREFVLEHGGVVRAVFDLCSALHERGHDVTLLTANASGVPEAWLAGDGPRVVEIAVRPRPLPRVTGRDRATVEAELDRAEVLHLHVPWDSVCVQLGTLARRRDLPTFVSIHGMLDDWCMTRSTLKKRLFLMAGGRRMLESAAAVHCTAQAEADQSRRWYPGGRAAVLPLVLELEPYVTLPGPELALDAFDLQPGPARLLFLSRIDPKKAVEVLIEAVARLRDDGRELRLLIAGTGPTEYVQMLHALVEQRALQGVVTFLGFVSGPTKISLYQAADLMVLPTNQENWGFVLVEALAAGAPVVTTRGVDIWPELEASGGAAIVEQDAGAIAELVGRLLDDDEGRRAMGIAGRRWALEYLDRDRVIDQYERLYEGAV